MAANPPAVPGRHKPVVLLCCPVFRFCQRFSLELPVERATQNGSGRAWPSGSVILALIWPRCLQAALFGSLCGTWKPFYYSVRILWLQLVRSCRAGWNTEILPPLQGVFRSTNIYEMLGIMSDFSFNAFCCLSASVHWFMQSLRLRERTKRIYFQVGLSRSLESRTELSQEEPQ